MTKSTSATVKRVREQLALAGDSATITADEARGLLAEIDKSETIRDLEAIRELLSSYGVYLDIAGNLAMDESGAHLWFNGDEQGKPAGSWKVYRP